MAQSRSRRPKKTYKPPAEPSLTDRFSKMFAPPELYDARKRRDWDLGETDLDRGPYVIELNLQHIEGLTGAAKQLEALHEKLMPQAPKPVRIARTYLRCEMNVREWQSLLREDERLAHGAAKESGTDAMQHRAIYKLWPDFPIKSQICRSISTIKADAALQSYEAAGEGIVWAVLDSGIDHTHPHFGEGSQHLLEAPNVRDLHRSFVRAHRTSPRQRVNRPLRSRHACGRHHRRRRAGEGRRAGPRARASRRRESQCACRID
jgi:serine protease AprX